MLLRSMAVNPVTSVNDDVLLWQERMKKTVEDWERVLPMFQHFLYSHYAHAGIPGQCQVCFMRRASYRCVECFDSPAWCSSCVVTAHKNQPFHWVDRWNGRHFERRDLGTDPDLDFIISLGHKSSDLEDDDDEAGQRCCPKGQKYKMTVVHVNGVHSCTVATCTCVPTIDTFHAGLPAQLLNAGLFPATSGEFPRSVFTFEFLHMHRIFSVQTKCSGRDFMRAVERLSSSLGLAAEKQKVCRMWVLHRKRLLTAVIIVLLSRTQCC